MTMRITLWVIVLLLAAHPGLAQVETQPWPSLPNPGARSLGLGGAFAAQADDATAAFVNPAGLVQLLRPEVSAELRLWGDNNSDDSDEIDDLTGVSFVSFVYPYRGWAVALYRHQLARFDLGDVTGGEAFTEASVETTGLSVAYRVNDRVLLGLGLTYNEGELGTVNNSALGEDWGLTAGLLWRAHRLLQVGGFYRQGPTLDSGTADDRINIPDMAGIGCSMRSDGGHVLLSAELDRVMSDGFSADAHEAHVGAEYAFLGSPVFAVRGGAWRALGSDLDGNDEIHWAGGFGFAFEHFQFDFAADISDSIWTVSTSAIVSF